MAAKRNAVTKNEIRKTATCKTIAEIAPLVKRWRAAQASDDHAGQARLDDAIGAKFDLLIELITDHSFVARRQTVTNIGDFKYASIAMTIFGLLLAAARCGCAGSR